MKHEKKRDNSMLGVTVYVTRPPDGLWPNRSYTSSAMMWGRCRYNYIGRPNAMDMIFLKAADHHGGATLRSGAAIREEKSHKKVL